MYELVSTSSKYRWNIYRTSGKCLWSIYRTSRKRRGTLRVVHKSGTEFTHSDYLNCWWHSANETLRNKSKILNQHTTNSTLENESQGVICKIAAILFRPQCNDRLYQCRCLEWNILILKYIPLNKSYRSIECRNCLCRRSQTIYIKKQGMDEYLTEISPLWHAYVVAKEPIVISIQRCYETNCLEDTPRNYNWIYDMHTLSALHVPWARIQW